eukprot:gene565-9_t
MAETENTIFLTPESTLDDAQADGSCSDDSKYLTKVMVETKLDGSTHPDTSRNHSIPPQKVKGVYFNKWILDGKLLVRKITPTIQFGTKNDSDNTTRPSSRRPSSFVKANVYPQRPFVRLRIEAEERARREEEERHRQQKREARRKAALEALKKLAVAVSDAFSVIIGLACGAVLAALFVPFALLYEAKSLWDKLFPPPPPPPNSRRTYLFWNINNT